MKHLKVGMAQMAVIGADPKQNLETATTMIAKSGKLGCDIVVLPECLDIGWTNPAAKVLALPIPGTSSEALCNAARKAQIYVVAGLTEKSGDLLFNASVLISPSGSILLKHRKIDEIAAGEIYATGDVLRVAKTNIGTIGITICSDNFTNPETLGHALSKLGASLVLSPCSWAISGPNWAEDAYGKTTNIGFHGRHKIKESYQLIARNYGISVVGVSNVGVISSGPWKGRDCIGSSLAIGNTGEVLACASYGQQAEELVVVKVPAPDRN